MDKAKILQLFREAFSPNGLILGDNFMENINKPLYYGSKTRLIDSSIQLKRDDLVDILLAHGAQVDKTTMESFARYNSKNIATLSESTSCFHVQRLLAELFQGCNKISS